MSILAPAADLEARFLRRFGPCRGGLAPAEGPLQLLHRGALARSPPSLACHPGSMLAQVPRQGIEPVHRSFVLQPYRWHVRRHAQIFFCILIVGVYVRQARS